MIKNKKIKTIIKFCLIFAFSILSGFALKFWFLYATTPKYQTPKINYIYNTIKSTYVEKLDDKKIEDGLKEYLDKYEKYVK